MDQWATVVEITDTEQKQEKTLKRNKDIYRDLWDNTKHTNICLTRAPEDSGLENSMDCIVHGIAKSQTPLRDFYFHFQISFFLPLYLTPESQ